MQPIRRRAVRRLIAFAVTMVCVSASASAAEAAKTGQVRFVKEASSEFDSYTRSPSRQDAAWMRDHYFRQKAYAPYFDSRLAWYPDGWAYKDLYAIYVDEDLAKKHPEWILRDSQGRKLYIPWGCGGGTCPQYAGDIGNPEFRAHWIAEAREAMAAGYTGLFVDDVNMEFRVGNGDGEEVPPVDRRTGATMSHAAWRRYTAEFVEQIRRSFPDVEVAHNPIWYSGHEDQYVRRALLAADYVNLERGVSDDGLTRGGGQFGYETFLRHVDWLHRRGKAVVLDSYATDRAGAEYNLASYFLVNGTRDGFRTDYRNLPDDWWSGYDVDLGAARGRRYEWKGLLRRDFERGYVLVNQPDSPARRVRLGRGATGPDGARRSSVRLGAAAGAVVVRSRRRGSRISLRSIPNPPRSAAAASRSGRTQGGRLSKAVMLRGRILGGLKPGARVQIDLRRVVAGNSGKRRRARVRVDSRGRFSKLFKGLPTGRYKAHARYPAHRRSASVRRFSVRR